MIVNCTLKFPFCPLFVFLDGMHFAGQKFNLKNIHSFAFPAFRGFSPACGVTATGCRQPCAATIGRRCISALTWKSILCSAPRQIRLINQLRVRSTLFNKRFFVNVPFDGLRERNLSLPRNIEPWMDFLGDRSGIGGARNRKQISVLVAKCQLLNLMRFAILGKWNLGQRI